MSYPLGHGLGGVQDLPVPGWLFYWGASIVLVVSFVALWALWQRPILAEASRGRPMPRLEAVAWSTALRVLLGALSFALFAFVLVAAAIGDTSPDDNVAPRFVFVYFWLGVPALSALFGNVWSVLSPWRAAADAAAWVSERAQFRWEAPFADPQRWGRWPGAGLLLGFAALELAYWDNTNPRAGTSRSRRSSSATSPGSCWRTTGAVELFESPRKAAISQYAMLALMVVYTVAGLWLLSR